MLLFFLLLFFRFLFFCIFFGCCFCLFELRFTQSTSQGVRGELSCVGAIIRHRYSGKHGCQRLGNCSGKCCTPSSISPFRFVVVCVSMCVLYVCIGVTDASNCRVLQQQLLELSGALYNYAGDNSSAADNSDDTVPVATGTLSLRWLAWIYSYSFL